MDIEQKISEVETELSRLSQQHEQEAAMAEVLPLRFLQNMEGFKSNMPGIHDFFESYQPTRPFRFFCNENGIPNILWLDTEIALYGEDPFSDAQTQIAEVIDKSILQCIDFAPQWYLDDQIHIKYNNEISKLKQKPDQAGLLLKDALPLDILR